MVKNERQLLMKPELLQNLMALPAKEMQQIMGKITMLTQDPTPDGRVKRILKYMGGKLHRIRCGAYRVLYTYDTQSLNVLTVRRRDADTYKDGVDMDDELDPDELGALQIEITLPKAQPDWESIFAKNETPLPEPITIDLLKRLGIAKAYHVRLLQIKTEEALWECPGLDDDTILKIHQYMYETPLTQVMQQPDLILKDVEDLLRYKNGELLTFLLKLSPDQERYTRWPLNAAGPMLVKGGPGTGKSTVALYRVRSLLQQLQRAGQNKPAILFTTYTNALVKSSEQLLEQLLSTDAQFVRVQTTDKIVAEVLFSCKQHKSVLTQQELYALTRQAIAETMFEGNTLLQAAQKMTIGRMGLDYLLAEITTVIVARQVKTLAAYLGVARNGRKLRLNGTQRRAVWKVYERWCILVEATGKETWQQQRARAETLVEQSRRYRFYDAVIIDEAQDLDPGALRLLIKLCKGISRVFITADANQSIYGSGFTWADVHQDLKFQGRTNILRANYRSTCEIGEAAQSYLTYGSLEPEVIEREYINNGPIPDVRAVMYRDHEIRLLASYLRKACSDQRLTLSSCAVLCPGEETGRHIVAQLEMLDIKASYMTSRDLDLKKAGVKVLPLKAAKGLEFPIVALAGFLGSSYPDIPLEASEEAQEELLARERRTLYVGMTRAMRTLLVIVPVDPHSPILEGFDSSYWSMGK